MQPAGVLFSAGQAQLTMADYLTYMLQADDERPLYIFDKLFVSKAPKLGEDYRYTLSQIPQFRLPAFKKGPPINAFPFCFVFTPAPTTSVPLYFDESRDMFALLKDKVRRPLPERHVLR
jgi:hypothetical protein